ncbi:hypothetical protein C0992_008496 [Termitomyces sp. T32_za158]|nr:hypothetical protein C0992_008496 [Termitomyces sp. T32_za158]
MGLPGLGQSPEELIKSKLDPCSVKTQLVGYANSGYQLFNQENWMIMTLRDVIFEEGTGHRALTILDSGDEEVQPTSVVTPLNSAQGILTNRQSITPKIRPGNKPLHPQVPDPGHTLREAQTITPDITPQRVPTPVALVQHLTRIAKLSPALVAAQETIQHETEARAGGKAWAEDDDVPMALMAENPYAYLSMLVESEEGSDLKVPKTYMEAMK